MAVNIRGNTSKWALRQIYNLAPRELIELPKAGSMPIGQWLRELLHPWASEPLHPDRLARGGYVYSEPIIQPWHQHLSGATTTQPSSGAC